MNCNEDPPLAVIEQPTRNRTLLRYRPHEPSTAKWKPACLLTLVLAASNALAADVPGPIETVWKTQLLELNYHSTSVSYSCFGIAAKVATMLERLGARPGVQVWNAHCPPGMMSSMHRLKIRVETPFAATPELLQEMTTFDAREQLVAKVRGETLPGAADVERFTANWKSVSLSRDFDSGDCELVEALRKQVLPKLSVHVASRSQHCPSTGYHGALRMKVVALLPLREDERSSPAPHVDARAAANDAH